MPDAVLLRPPPVAAPWPAAPGWLPLDEDAVARIVAIDDPAVRNLWITQSYADLGRRLLMVLDTDQTWCTFAIWASNTAGVSIRCAELPHMFDALLSGADDHVGAVVSEANRHAEATRRHHRIGHFGRDHLERLVRRALGQASERIAHGNTLVYSELAPLFVRLVEYLETADPTDAAGRETVDDVLQRLRIPTPDEDPLVGSAFGNYLIAARATDPTERAHRALAANVAAVLHEQRRLQDDIAAALDAGLLDAREDFEDLVHEHVPWTVCQRLVDAAVDRTSPHLERLWGHIATKLLMTLIVPERTLHLGVDVPVLPEGGFFPPALIDLGGSDAAALVAEWDPTGGTGRGSGARDWSVIHDRMGYIVNLFRSRQQRLVLTAPPFTQAECDHMMSGRLPPSIGSAS